MKKHIYILLVLLFPLFVFSQYVEVEGCFIADSIDVSSGLIKNVADPISAQDAATKAYVDILEAKVDSLGSILDLFLNSPIAFDDLINIYDSMEPFDIDVLDQLIPDFDPDDSFRYGNFIKITNAGSTPGSSNNLSVNGRALFINDNGSIEDYTDDFIIYTPDTVEVDYFYYVITDLDGLKDTAMVEVDVKSGYVQERLDAGETPKQIYDSDNSLLDSLYGKTYQGGLIAYLDTAIGTGLIAAPVDQSAGAEWGCAGVEIGGTSSSIGTGQANTDTIVVVCAETGIAARLCDDLVSGGYDDWFLPSKDELNEIYVNLKLNGFGGFSDSFYWSSTEYSNDEDFAWSQDLLTGIQLFSSKAIPWPVRAVREY